MERTQGGTLDKREERTKEGACPAGLRVPEEGGYEPAGSQALERPGGLSLGAGDFQKKLPERLKELEEAHPKAEVELWAEDEARLGLKPVMRRMWAPVGRRPIVRIVRFKRGYEWTYLYGFVRPESGEV